MKNYFYFFKIIFIAFLCNNSLFSQENTLAIKKSIKRDLETAGIAFYDFDVAKSLEFSKRGLNNAYKIKDDESIAKAYNIIGLNFEEFYDVKKGIEFYDKALHHANLTQNDSIKCWINNNLGSVYSYRKINFDKGIEHYKSALIFAKKIKDSIEITYTQLNIASAYFAENRFDDGIDYLKACEKFITIQGQLEAKISLNSLLGSYYSHNNDFEKAEFFFNKALEFSKLNESELVDSNVADLYLDVSEFYKKKQDYKKAFYFLDLREKAQSEIYNEQRSQNAKVAGSQIEIDEYKRQIEKIEDETEYKINKSKLIILLFIVIFIILLVLVYSLYKNSKFKQNLNQKLENTNKQLQVAKDEAEEASRLKTQFVSTITHELRTPLYGVVGITDILVDEHKELANNPHLNSLKFSARYLLSLVNDILQINKIEEKKVVLEKMVFNVSDEIQTIVNSLDFIAKKNNNILVTDIDNQIPELLVGDKLRLSQVFMNLVSNALKFTKNGKVTVSAKVDRIFNNQHFIYFEVADTGVGISKDDQAKIFDKFTQLQRKEGDYQGTGLGLSIVKKLVELFGSKIEVESEPKVGTKFYFTIGFESDEETKNHIINNIDVDLSVGFNYKILVVEDNKINQIVTKKILDNYKIKSQIVDDGYAAINLLETEKFDIILMDINMPIINGFETSKIIREKGIDIPIIALTAFDKQEITEQCLSVGINDILIKPFEPQKLFQIMKNVVKN